MVANHAQGAEFINTVVVHAIVLCAVQITNAAAERIACIGLAIISVAIACAQPYGGQAAMVVAVKKGVVADGVVRRGLVAHGAAFAAIAV